MIRECRLGYKWVVDKSHPGFAEDSVVYISFPQVKNFCDRIVFEELDVGDYVKHSALMHPVGQADYLCRGLSLSWQSFSFICPDMHYTIGTDRVILQKG